MGDAGDTHLFELDVRASVLVLNLHRLRALARGRPIERGAAADINVVIREVEDLLRSDARTHRARLEFELTDALPAVLVDAAQIQHVLINLVHNGFQATSSDGTAGPAVCIRTRRAEDDSIEVAVCDNGPGLSALALERLFDPFFSTKEDGTGLGLPISHSVIRAQGGTLGYRSNLPRGACFYFRLPAEAAHIST